MRGWTVVLGGVLAGGVARADEPDTVSLNWVRLPGAESCIAPQALARAVEARVGRPVLVPLARADWALEGRVERRGGAWVATVSATRGDGGLGVRTVRSTAPDCAALDPQLLVVVTLLLDSAGVLTEPPAPPSPIPSSPPRALPVTPSSPAPGPCAAPSLSAVLPSEPSPPWSAPRRVRVELGVGLAMGWHPTLVPMLHAALTGWPSGTVVSFRGELGVVLSREAAYDEGAAGYASLQGGGAVCVSLLRFTQASLCAGVLVAAHRSEGLGVGGSIARWNFGVTAPVRVRLEAPLGGRWSVLASWGGAVHLAWPRWVLADPDGAFQRDLGPSLPLAFLTELSVGHVW